MRVFGDFSGYIFINCTLLHFLLLYILTFGVIDFVYDKTGNCEMT